jgi:hypothetical protein
VVCYVTLSVEHYEYRHARASHGGSEKEYWRISERKNNYTRHRTGNSQRQIDKRGINAQGCTTVMGGDIPHRLHAESGKYQRKTKTGQGSASLGRGWNRSEPEQDQS